MSSLLIAEAKQQDHAPITATGSEAAKITNLSAKTLERLAAAGEKVGRFKVNRRTLFLRSALEAWLVAKAAQ